MWFMGSFFGFIWEKVEIFIIVGILGFLMIVFIIKFLNVFLLGEEYVKSIGINIRFFRVLIVFIFSILVVIVLVFVGFIGFIGFVVL